MHGRDSLWDRVTKQGLQANEKVVHPERSRRESEGDRNATGPELLQDPGYVGASTQRRISTTLAYVRNPRELGRFVDACLDDVSQGHH